LFEADFYTSIFGRDTTAAQIVLVDLIARRVQANKDRFPAAYLRSWRLTKLVSSLPGKYFRVNGRISGASGRFGWRRWNEEGDGNGVRRSGTPALDTVIPRHA
jgi:hypothetical protein